MEKVEIGANCTRSKTVLLSLIFFIGGVAAGSILEISQWWWVLAIGSFALLAIDHKNKLVLCLFFCLVGFGLGTWRVDQAKQMIPEGGLGQFNGEVEVVGSELKQDYQRIVIRPEMEDGSNNQKFIVFTDPYPVYDRGEYLDVDCSLEKPENKYEKFNYQMFLAKDKIYQICTNATIERTGLSKTSLVMGPLMKLKSSLERKISVLLPEPESGYLSGLLLGGSDQLGADVSEQFRRTGTTHTVAVSGYNITILASVLMMIGILLGFWRSPGILAGGWRGHPFCGDDRLASFCGAGGNHGNFDLMGSQKGTAGKFNKCDLFHCSSDGLELAVDHSV